MTPLGRLIAERIAQNGAISVGAYMALCLGHPEHGYYRTRDPFGAHGDFTTAPEISQMFGEMIGLWGAQVWADQRLSAPVVLAELGPGRGTLMRDALRAAQVLPEFRAAVRPWLIETSPVLRAQQAEALAEHDVRWAETHEALPEGPVLVVANEFFDALPVRQFRRSDLGWQERLVERKGAGFGFGFGRPLADPDLDARFPHLPDGVLVEVSPLAESIVAALASRIARWGGAALILDYGAWQGSGDTLQALRAHAPADPLADPGAADLTAHVDFAALAKAAGEVRVSGPVPQGVFLERLGIAARAQALATGAGGDAARTEVATQHRRLTHPEEMGVLFKVLALSPPQGPPLPGF